MADSDFDAITLNRKMCDANGNIGSVEFCNIMKRQIRYYTQQRLSENAFTKFKTPEDAEFTQLGALKLILLEQLSHTSTLSNICAHLHVDPQQLLCPPSRATSVPTSKETGEGEWGDAVVALPKNASASLRKLPVRRTDSPSASMRERSAPVALDDEQSAGAYPSPSCCSDQRSPPENANERLACNTSCCVPSQTSGQTGRGDSCPGQPAPPVGPDETGGDVWAAAVAGLGRQGLAARGGGGRGRLLGAGRVRAAPGPRPAVTPAPRCGAGPWGMRASLRAEHVTPRPDPD